MKTLTFGIDFDGTLSGSHEPTFSETAMWGNILRAMQAYGHKAVICTMRTGHELDRQQIDRWQTLAGTELPVIFVGDPELGEHSGYKDGACRAAGYKVDIWIDDMPETCCAPVPMLRTEP